MAKVGSQVFSSAVRSQVAKDAWLESHGYDVEWHFFEGANGLDLDPALTDALDDAHIPYFIHLA